MVAYPPLHVLQGARLEFAGKKPGRFHGRGHFDQMTWYLAKAKRRIVRLIADKDNQMVASDARRFHTGAHQRSPDALIFPCRTYGQGAEKQSRSRANMDWR